MNYARIKFCDIANGPGVRVSLFVSGCRRHCPECFNPETWAFDYGEPFSADVEEQIISVLNRGYIEGLSVLGGEPFEPENQTALIPFLRKVRERCPGKSVWCYTGNRFEDLAGDMLELIDVLVDGEFIASQKNIGLRFRGSSNQRIIDVKERRERYEDY